MPEGARLNHQPCIKLSFAQSIQQVVHIPGTQLGWVNTEAYYVITPRVFKANL